MKIDVEGIRKDIFKNFEGIEAARERALQEINYVSSKTDKYTPDYVEKFKQEKKQELLADRKARAEKAKQELAEVMQALAKKRFKDPYQELYDDPNKPVITTEDKLFIEKKRDRKLVMLQAEIDVADSPGDFKKLLDKYGEDEYFYNLINLEIKKRAKSKEDGAHFQALQMELEQGPPELQELKKLNNVLSFFGNVENHPSGLESGDYANIRYEPLI